MKLASLMIPALCVAMTCAAFAQDNARKDTTPRRQGQGQQGQRGQPREQFSADALVEKLFADAKDKDKLTLEEYKKARSAELDRMKERMGDRFNAEQAEKRIADAFKRYDKGDKGYITKDEFKAGLEADRKAIQENATNRPQGNRPQRNRNAN